MSTIRVYQNNNRIATAVTLKDGRILQVYPAGHTYASETEFRTVWRNHVANSLDFKQTERSVKCMKKAVAPASAPAPVKQAPTVTTEGWLCAKGQREYTAPPGTYYIGDLCYALPDNIYEKVFGELGGYSNGFYFKGNDFFMMSGTAYGDGEYKGSDGKKFAVDAGIIGIAPVKICDMSKSSITGGHIYTFHRPVNCRFHGGLFDFYEDGYRTLRIDTVSFEDDDCCCDDC